MNRSFKKWKLIIIGEGEDKYKSKLADLIKSLIYKEKFFSQEFRFILRDLIQQNWVYYYLIMRDLLMQW